MCFKYVFNASLFWLASSSNYHRDSIFNIVRRYLIRSATAVVPVLSIYVLKVLRIPRKFSGWQFSNMAILSLYVSDISDISDVSDSGLSLILTLMMLLAHYSSAYAFIRGIGGGLICAWMPALIQLGFLWSFMYVDVFILVTVEPSQIVTLQSAVKVSYLRSDYIIYIS